MVSANGVEIVSLDIGLVEPTLEHLWTLEV
jgi:hypothetical protein